MLELFVNPITMAAGGLLISSPIIIHLINRMRFRRIRWAAIEFLLKAQKRKQRQLIIEQIILLLLRILLVLLLGLLLARFLGCSGITGAESQQTLHIFLLDDTPSMGDVWREEGESKETFNVAKNVITEKICKYALQAPTAQLVEVIRLSDLENPRDFGRLNSQSLEDLKTWLTPLKPSPIRVELIAGLQKIQNVFTNLPPGTELVVHLISDFRGVDWAETNKSQLTEVFNQFRSAGAKVVLVDVAHPDQGDSKSPIYHENLSIVDLRPDTRIAAQYQQVEFTVEVANYSNAERKNVRIAVKLNGRERAEGSVNIPSLPPNEITKARFQLAMDRLGTEESPMERFNLVTANLETEANGLNIDNVRYTVVELRKAVPILLVEGRPNQLKLDSRNRFYPASQQAESFFLHKLLTDTVKGYQVDVKAPVELEKTNFNQYLSVWICGVPKFSDVVIKNLEDYVKSGGGLALFLSPDIKTPDANFYNEKMVKKGDGLYPAPIETRPLNEGIEDDKVVPSKWMRRLSGQPQIFTRDREHPALESLYADTKGVRSDGGGFDRILQFVVIDRYFPVNRLAWKDDPNYDIGTKEIMTLPNLKPMSTYTARARALMDQVAALAENNEEYGEVLKKYSGDIKRIADSPELPLFNLSKVLEDFLNDPGDPDKKKPSMQVFWQKPEVSQLQKDLVSFRDQVKFGDPLYISKTFGLGRVIASTSAAGSSWNDLEGLSVAHYPPLMMSFQRYLASASSDLNLILGTSFEFRVNQQLYKDRVKKYFLTQSEGSPLGGGQANTGSAIAPRGDQALQTKIISKAVKKDPTKKDAKEEPAGEPEKFLALNFDEALLPGAYLFEFTEVIPPSVPGGDPKLQPDYRALAYNINARLEGDLKRVDRDSLKLITGKEAELVTPETVDKIEDKLKKRQHDLSEASWFYLLLILILVAEQAMAVRLSFHTRGSDHPSQPAAPIVTGHGVIS